MAKLTQLSDDLVQAITRVGTPAVLNWFSENDVKIPLQGNVFDKLNAGLLDESISIDQIISAITELEESSNKKIFLMQADHYKNFEREKDAILRHLKRKYSYSISEGKRHTGSPKQTPTFVYMNWQDHTFKIKFSESQYNMEPNYEKLIFDKVTLIVCIVIIIDTKTGFTQVRFDKPGLFHSHKNDERKATETAYEQHYKNLLQEIFPGIQFSEMNLNGVVNYIAKKEKKKFLLNKGVTTITNNAKQTFATASNKADIRLLPEYAAAAAKGEAEWLSEDLTGYWMSAQSDGALNRDLFMRISRRQSQIRIQRGCLEKELNYGIEQIRKIQKAV